MLYVIFENDDERGFVGKDSLMDCATWIKQNREQHPNGRYVIVETVSTFDMPPEVQQVLNY